MSVRSGRRGSVRGGVAALAMTWMMVMAIAVPASAASVILNIDLGITKVDTQDPVAPGVPFQYVLDYVNNGPSLGRDVWVVDTLPPEISYQSDDSSCSHAAGVISCSVGDLDAGIGGQIRITVTANAGVVGTFINNARIESRWVPPQGVDIEVVDTNPANDQDDEDTTVAPPALGSIGDFVWLDSDGDSVQDAGEPGIGGVTVNLTGPSGPLSMVTAANGSYVFTGLPAGDYVATVAVATAPASHAITTPSVFNIALGAGAAFLTADYGFKPPPTPPASIGDFVWNDLDRDGVQDAGEPGIGGVKLTLTGPGGTKTTTTGADGMYLFTGLGAGSYTVAIDVTTAPATFTATTPVTHLATVAAGDAYLLADFGLAAPPSTPMIDLELVKDVAPATVTVGQQAVFTITLTNKGPAGATGVVVGDLLPSGVTYVSSAKVTAGGVWTVGALAAGATTTATITVTVDQAGSFTNVAEVTKADQNDIDSVPNDGKGDDWDDATVSATAVLASGTIGDTVWLDANGNGIEDSGEPGIAGALVTLANSECTASGTSSPACVMATATTDADGRYLFSALGADTYTVKVVQSSVADNLALTTPGTVTVNLADGATFLLADYGFTEVLPKTGMDAQALGALAAMLLGLGVLVVAPRGRLED